MYTPVSPFRSTLSDGDMAVAQQEIPQVKVSPLVAATLLCSQLRALQQASVSAEHCEAICKDMVATTFCRAGMLCDLVVAVHRVQEHADSVNAAFLSILQTVDCATDELYRCVLHGFLLVSSMFPCSSLIDSFGKCSSCVFLPEQAEVPAGVRASTGIQNHTPVGGISALCLLC